MNQTIEILLKFILILISMLILMVISSHIHSKNIFNFSKFFEEWTDYGMYLAHATKSFDAEKDAPIDYRILQQKTKCFSCERELFAHNPQSIYLGAPTKCFSCERQMLGE
jgi:hypothetical protein